jgi:biofilm PGA synthesis N-glycosyltransferase PgaC
MESIRYAIVTPARNEADRIEQTIRAMASQSTLPVKWVIVSDGSTDGTDDIIKQYLQRFAWMDYVRMPEHRNRQFAAKVSAFNAGLARIEPDAYDIIGNLDADITFDSEYFEYLIDKFSHNPNLGVAGTPFVEDGKAVYDYRFTNIEHVSGACQLFRKECFAEIGGYQPVKGGGIDWIAVTTARMKGWQTQTFTGKVCYHHRQIGTGGHSSLIALYRHGQKDYYLGGHILWQVFRSLYQMTKRPYAIGGLMLLAGYISGIALRMKRPIEEDLIQFHRHEQMERLRRKLRLLPVSHEA